jgi:deferrochelatase/peroxidase EfeB
MPDTTDPGQPSSVPPESVPPRRAFLRGALGAGAAGAVGGAAAGYAYRATRPAPASQQALERAQAGALPPVPFHGRYQVGILPLAQRQTAVISFNATADGWAELTDLFRTITARARFLTAGGTPPPAGIGAPPSDSGVLGPTVASAAPNTAGSVAVPKTSAASTWTITPQAAMPIKHGSNTSLDAAICSSAPIRLAGIPVRCGFSQRLPMLVSSSTRRPARSPGTRPGQACASPWVA